MGTNERLKKKERRTDLTKFLFFSLSGPFLYGQWRTREVNKSNEGKKQNFYERSSAKMATMKIVNVRTLTTQQFEGYSALTIHCRGRVFPLADLALVTTVLVGRANGMPSLNRATGVRSAL